MTPSLLPRLPRAGCGPRGAECGVGREGCAMKVKVISRSEEEYTKPRSQDVRVSERGPARLPCGGGPSCPLCPRAHTTAYGHTTASVPLGGCSEERSEDVRWQLCLGRTRNQCPDQEVKVGGE